MRNKKLLSTVVASALVATTMVMPAMAADQGEVNVEFTTKNPVIRVQAPTSILAAVDPLEMNTAGTQIHSTDFTLVNKSEVPVKIDVKSVVTLGTGVTLVDAKQKAIDSKDKTKSEAWLAVAAQTSSGKYIETANKTAGDLTEADKNVATFKTEASESAANQTFYLNKTTDTTATTGYTLIAPESGAGKKDADAYKKELTYAQVYELTVDTTISDDATLLSELAQKDIYVGTADTDGTTLKLLPAGTTTLDAADKWATSNKYFTAGTENALTSDANPITDGKKYVYGEASAAGTDTAFRYIGKLGSGKTSWSDADIDEMDITYSIYGLTGDDYSAANTQYGLYLAGPQLSTTATGLFTITGLSADCKFKSLTATYQGAATEMNSDRGTWSPSAPSASTTGTVTFQLGDGWMSALAGQSTTVALTYTEGGTDKTVTSTVTIQASQG